MPPDRFALPEVDRRLYAGRLYNHDYLWFSSFEISKTAATAPLIHNYALSYALSGYSYGIYSGNAPRYAEDLDRMLVYATPARSEGTVQRTRFTQNAVNSRTLRTDDAPKGINSPALGWRLVLNPVWRDRVGEVEHGFTFYVFADSAHPPPALVRLGKKGCPIRVEWEEIANAQCVFVESSVTPSHAVNPLDVSGQIVTYEPVSIPPHLVMRRAEIKADWFVISGEHRVQVPRRFTAWKTRT
jgi:CRISPR-associated protein Csc1